MRHYNNNLEATSLYDLDPYTVKKNALQTCPFCLASEYTFNSADSVYNCHSCDKQFTGFEGDL